MDVLHWACIEKFSILLRIWTWICDQSESVINLLEPIHSVSHILSLLVAHFQKYAMHQCKMENIYGEMKCSTSCKCILHQPYLVPYNKINEALLSILGEKLIPIYHCLLLILFVEKITLLEQSITEVVVGQDNMQWATFNAGKIKHSGWTRPTNCNWKLHLISPPSW